jgi:hypothetical protein
LPVSPLETAASPIAAEMPKPIAWKFQRPVIAAGKVIVELLGVANIASSRSALCPAGIVTDGAVMLVEEALACPLVTSIGAAVLTPL